jgi:MFS superfamily sulfate permease-like transporter
MATPDSYIREEYFEEYYMPWGDRVLKGEDPKIYEKRNAESIPVIFGYLIIYSVLLGFMFNRYIQSNLFWTIFTIIIIWGILAVLSIWYIILHSGILAGICLALLFILLQMLLMNVSIEEEHQNRIHLIKTKYVSK